MEGIVAAFGVSMPSVIIILIVASLMQSFMSNHYLAIALMGVRSGVCALVLNTLFGLWKNSIVDKVTFFIFAFALVLLTVANINPVYSVLLGAVLGIASHFILNKRGGIK